MLGGGILHDVYVCQNSLNVILKWVYFMILHTNKINFKANVPMLHCISYTNEKYTENYSKV